MKILYLFLICLGILSCRDNSQNLSNNNIEAWVPIYAQPGEINILVSEPARATNVAGKIYSYGNYIFQNENNKGFHIINNSNLANPAKIAFLKVPFSTEIAIKSGYLYTNNVNDLVVFDLSNPTAPVFVKRVKDAFPVINQTYPPVTNVYFECTDASKGIVVGWEIKTIPTPKCRR